MSGEIIPTIFCKYKQRVVAMSVGDERVLRNLNGMVITMYGVAQMVIVFLLYMCNLIIQDLEEHGLKSVRREWFFSLGSSLTTTDGCSHLSRQPLQISD